jgi:aromatic-L-amino-acid decarboxylase
VTPEDFRRHGHRLIDWLADYQQGLASRPVMATTRPGEVRDALPATRHHRDQTRPMTVLGARAHLGHLS